MILENVSLTCQILLLKVMTWMIILVLVGFLLSNLKLMFLTTLYNNIKKCFQKEH